MIAANTKGRLWLLGGMLLMLGCTASPGTSVEPQAASEDNAVVHTVRIVQMKYEPAEIHVRKGDQIVFFNQDMVTHDVTEEKSRAWASPPIPPGESWTLVARQNDDYYCSIHQVMKGRVVVE
jgi:plastocyanin